MNIVWCEHRQLSAFSGIQMLCDPLGHLTDLQVVMDQSCLAPCRRACCACLEPVTPGKRARHKAKAVDFLHPGMFDSDMKCD